MEYLEKTYVDKNMLEKIDDNVTDIKRQFGEYIGGITTRESWEEVANKASKLATSILATGSYYAFVQLDKEEANDTDKHYAIVELDKKETIGGFRCPFCKNSIDFERTDENTISCPKCGKSLEPLIEKGE